MSQTVSNSTTLHSVSGLFGEVQLVSTSQGVLLDLQSRIYDSEGRLHRQHALAPLSLADARRVHERLGAAIDAAEVADPRQPGLWGNSTAGAIVLEKRHSRGALS